MQKLVKGTRTKVRKCLQYLVLSVGLLVLYVVLLMAGQAIPRRLVLDNVRESYLQLEKQGLYYEGIPGASWDNWTDSYFMNSAVTAYDGTLLQKAIANAYTTYSELDESGSANTIDDVKYALEQDSDAIVKPYSRYWVGMLTVYKILLLFMPINGIRTLMFAVAAALFLVSAVGVYKMLGAKGLVPYVASVAVAAYFPQALCLVFNTDIVMMFLMMAVCWQLFRKNATTEQFAVLFFLGGSVLAYLNYWAFPLITLGFPLVFVLGRGTGWNSARKADFVQTDIGDTERDRAAVFADGFGIYIKGASGFRGERAGQADDKHAGACFDGGYGNTFGDAVEGMGIPHTVQVLPAFLCRALSHNMVVYAAQPLYPWLCNPYVRCNL